MMIRRRLLCITQQRSFHHAIYTSQWNYTRAGLRRMKKPELISLAGQHQMDTTGTKNELIDRLLATPQQHQSEDISSKVDTVSKASVHTPSPQQQSMDTKPVDTTDSASKPSSSRIDSPPSPLEQQFTHETISSTAVDDHGIIKFEDDIDGYDQQWVEAFDLKVGNRRSGSGEKVNGFRHARTKQQQQSQPSQPSSSSTTHPGYVHQTLGDPANEKQLAGRSSPHRPTMEDTTVNTALPTDDDKLEFTDPEINQHWVNAFDQRVKTRAKIRDLDTLRADLGVGSLEHPQIDGKATNDGSEEPVASNKTIDIVIGSSLALWYIFGGEGIQSTISSFFS